MNLEHIHYNRIRTIILNDKNKVKHFLAINNMLYNYINMFGKTKLYKKLYLTKCIAFSKVVTKESDNKF